MATRRSTRLSSELDASGKVVNGKRKNGGGGEEGEGNLKKKRQGTRKPAFQPKPVPLPNSSNTPPEDDLLLELPPPPPSTKKIARRRDSIRAIRERPPSESPPSSHGMVFQSGGNSSKRQKTARERSMGSPLRGVFGTVDDPLAGVEETASMTSTGAAPSVQHLTFSKSHKPRPSAPQPSSPPRLTFGSSNLASSSKTPVSSSSMGPPSYVRKTRKSMGRTSRMHELQKDMVLPIMESETPVIRKNQELRGQQARRSSLDQRGGRASSSWGRGDITMPHQSVDYKMFYKHIPAAYPDPIKARMLLTWCASRAAGEILKASSRKGKERGKHKEVATEDGDQFIKDVMSDFLQRMNKGMVDTSTFGVPGQESVSVSGLVPHPRNVANRKAEAEMTTIIRRYKEENTQWSAIVNAANTNQQETLRRLEKKMMTNPDPDMSTAPIWMQQALSLADTVLSEPEKVLQPPENFEQIEYKVDVLHESSHVALQYVEQAGRFLNGVFSSLAADLRARDRFGLSPQLPPSDSDGPDTTALLASARAASSSLAAPTQNRAKTDSILLLRSLASVEVKLGR
ncbi:hypothetical protein L204_102163 [Cryptococcus depauperatus]